MQQELKNIFVTKEVAKLAKENGFNEICAGFFKIYEGDVFPNSNFDCEFFLGICDNPENFIEAPTHFQLMEWLLKNHELDVWRAFDSEWIVMGICTENPIFNINEALTLALNQINQQENGK